MPDLQRQSHGQVDAMACPDTDSGARVRDGHLEVCASAAPPKDAPQVVFLANDAVFGQALAFLESFRTHNPNLRLAMIPFADDIRKLERVAPVFNFDILKLNTARWDELSREFFPRVEQKYKNRLRKLAIFDLDHPATIYIDLDTVVLKDMSFIGEKLVNNSVDVICTAINNDPWVYNEKYKSHPQFAGSKRFSDGFFAFGARNIGQSAYRILSENRALFLEIRAAGVYSQSATNFILDMLGLRIGEVYNLYPKISPQVWYAGRLKESNGTVTAADGREVLFVHWAGPVDFDRDFQLKELFVRYQSAGKARIAKFEAAV
jgi:hypothetical protein